MKTSFISKRTHPATTGIKALGLVAVAWGAVYPALLWGLGALL